MFSFKKLLVLLLVLLMLPLFAFAYEEDPTKGTVNVKIINQQGEPISGSWYLHRGGLNGQTVRNGLSGETFQVDPGSYYLELRKVFSPERYDVYVHVSEDTQWVDAEEVITFTGKYYETQEDYDNELLGIEIREEDEEPAPEPPVVEEEEVVEEEAVEEDEEDSVVGAIIDYVVETSDDTNDIVEVYVPTFETAPQDDVPTFETAPQDSDLGVGGVGGGTLEEVTQLAVTGPGTLLLLIPSMFGGLLFATRKRK